jgi:hypothetical protein
VAVFVQSHQEFVDLKALEMMVDLLAINSAE